MMLRSPRISGRRTSSCNGPGARFARIPAAERARSPHIRKGEAMKTLSRVAYGAVLALLITAAAQADPLQPVRVTPDEFTWKLNPVGLQQTIITGDPQKPGVYVLRTRLPAG